MIFGTGKPLMATLDSPEVDDGPDDPLGGLDALSLDEPGPMADETYSDSPELESDMLDAGSEAIPHDSRTLIAQHQLDDFTAPKKWGWRDWVGKVAIPAGALIGGGMAGADMSPFAEQLHSDEVRSQDRTDKRRAQLEQRVQTASAQDQMEEYRQENLKSKRDALKYRMLNDQTNRDFRKGVLDENIQARKDAQAAALADSAARTIEVDSDAADPKPHYHQWNPKSSAYDIEAGVARPKKFELPGGMNSARGSFTQLEDDDGTTHLFNPLTKEDVIPPKNLHKPIPASEKEKVVTLQDLITAVTELQTLSKAHPDAIGPYDSAVASLRSHSIGNPQYVADIRQKSLNIKDLVARLRSGAQISPKELEQISAFTTDPSLAQTDFYTNVDNLLSSLTKMQKTRSESGGQGGRLADRMRQSDSFFSRQGQQSTAPSAHSSPSSIKVGDWVTLKNGHRVQVKAVHADGSFD